VSYFIYFVFLYLIIVCKSYVYPEANYSFYLTGCWMQPFYVHFDGLIMFVIVSFLCMSIVKPFFVLLICQSKYAVYLLLYMSWIWVIYSVHWIHFPFFRISFHTIVHNLDIIKISSVVYYMSYNYVHVSLPAIP
jgi:hypothetical protein